MPVNSQEKLLRQLALIFCLFCPSSASVLPAATAADNFTATGTIAQNNITQGNFTRNIPAFSPAFESQYVPVPGFGGRYTAGERFRMNALEKLPPRLTVDANVESSFRYELNPFQFPTKGQIKSKIFPTPDVFFQLPPETQNQLLDLLTLVNKSDVAYRVIPNLTVGWMLTPRLKAFSNYFFIKDTFLGRDHILSTNSHSISGGLHHDLPFKKRFTLSSDFQFRELFVKEADPFFDFLPSLTLSCAVTPRTSVFANTLLQLRGIKYFQAPTAEIDPFYTIGMSHQRGDWTLTSSLLLVTNYRSVFLGKNSEIQQDPFAFIYDTELSRPISKRYPSLRGFMRTEHIWNFHTNQSPGTSGYDFRLFWGAKMAVGKPSEYAFIDEIRRQLQLKEGIGAAPTSGTTN